MTNTLRAAIKALMNKFSIASMLENLTIVQAIDSNDEQIQSIQNIMPTYVYKAVITQSGTNAPDASYVLVDNLPNASFEYVSTGVYKLNFGGSIDPYTFNIIQNIASDTGGAGGTIGYVFGEVVGSTHYQISTTDAAGLASNDILFNYTLVIEAYPA